MLKQTLDKTTRFSALLLLSLLPGLAIAKSNELTKIDFSAAPTQTVTTTGNENYTVRWGVGPSLEASGADAGFSKSQKNFFARARQLSGEPILATGKSSKNDTLDEDTVVQTASFVELTIDPGKKTTLSLDSLKARIGAQRLEKDGKKIAGFSAQFFVRSSVDDYTSTLASARVYMDSGSTPTSVKWEDLSVNFPSTNPYQSITRPITLRIYIYITTTETDWLQVIRLDDLVVTGDAS